MSTTNKIKVLNFLQDEAHKGNVLIVNGFTTQILCSIFSMHRTNMSNILNSLVEEGFLKKSEKRPVKFRLNRNSFDEDSLFKKFIGANGSLNKTIQLAKSVILYPGEGLNSIILGPSGVEKFSFAKSMHAFAIANKVIRSDAPFIEVNCREFIESSKESLYNRFYYSNESFLKQAEGGILFIQHLEDMSDSFELMLSELLKIHYYKDEENVDRDRVIICSAIQDSDSSLSSQFLDNFVVKLYLPPLNSRPLSEQFELISSIFREESARLLTPIRISSSILRCILLGNYHGNIDQLRMEIKIGCANSNSRNFNSNSDELEIHIDDFQVEVIRGALHYADNQDEVDAIIAHDSDYIFTIDQTDTRMRTIQKKSFSVYEDIISDIVKLERKGLLKAESNLILRTIADNEIKRSLNDKRKVNINSDKLSVDSFMEEILKRMSMDVSQEIKKLYQVDQIQALGVHLLSNIKIPETTLKYEDQDIIECIENNKKEFQLFQKYTDEMSKHYSVPLGLDFTVFIIKYLNNKNGSTLAYRQPVVLIALSGDEVSNSYSKAINSLSRRHELFSLEIPTLATNNEIYELIKSKIGQIENDEGILMIHDRDEVELIGNLVQAENNIVIKTIKIPLLQIGLEISEKSFINNSIEDLYDDIIQGQRINEISTLLDQSHGCHRKAIIIISDAYDETDIYLRNYIKENFDVRKIQIIIIKSLVKELVLYELERHYQSHEILFITGIYDPRIFNILFIPLDQILRKEIPIEFGISPNTQTHRNNSLVNLFGAKPSIIESVITTSQKLKNLFSLTEIDLLDIQTTILKLVNGSNLCKSLIIIDKCDESKIRDALYDLEIETQYEFSILDIHFIYEQIQTIRRKHEKN